MGAGHSRKGGGPAKAGLNKLRGNYNPSTTGYFLLSFKEDKMKVVNGETSELSLLGVIIKRHKRIVKEGWDRHMTYTFRVSHGGRHRTIQMVSDTLLTLYQNGWQPMAPTDFGSKKKQNIGNCLQATIMFKKKCDTIRASETYSSRQSVLSSAGSSRDWGDSCLCLETYGSNYLGFHEVSNTILHELVTSIQTDHGAGVSGVSVGVASVISDYTRDMPPVLPSHPDLINEKYVQIGGNPWVSDDLATCQSLQMAIIACLTKEGYKLSLDINLDLTSRVYFFIRDSDSNSDEVLIPDMAKMDIEGENRPTVIGSKS